MANGEYAYTKLRDFVRDNLEYFEREEQKPVEGWGEHECADVIEQAVWTMMNVDMYDDCDEGMQFDGSWELIDALKYVKDESFVDDLDYYLLERGYNVQTLVGMAIAEELAEEGQ